MKTVAKEKKLLDEGAPGAWPNACATCHLQGPRNMLSVLLPSLWRRDISFGIGYVYFRCTAEGSIQPYTQCIVLACARYIRRHYVAHC